MSTRKERKMRRRWRDSIARLGKCAYGGHDMRYLTPVLDQCAKCNAVYMGRSL